MLETLNPDCVVHGFHRPRVHSVDLHHIRPQSWGGQTAPENLIAVCPTGHRSVHVLLAAYVSSKGTPSRAVLKTFTSGERAAAAKGWAAWTTAHPNGEMPPDNGL